MRVSYGKRKSLARLNASLMSLETNCREACIATIQRRFTSERRGLARRLDVPLIVTQLGIGPATALAAKVYELDCRRRGLTFDQLIVLPGFLKMYWELSRRKYLIQ